MRSGPAGLRGFLGGSGNDVPVVVRLGLPVRVSPPRFYVGHVCALREDAPTGKKVDSGKDADSNQHGMRES